MGWGSGARASSISARSTGFKVGFPTIDENGMIGIGIFAKQVCRGKLHRIEPLRTLTLPCGICIRENMETLADALTGVDYYLDSMEEQKPIGDGVLEVAEESMNALGFPVSKVA